MVAYGAYHFQTLTFLKLINTIANLLRRLALLLLPLLLATAERAGEPLIITNGFDIELVSAVDENGERPSVEAQTLRLTFRRPTTNSAARLPITYGIIPRREGDPEDFQGVEVLFADGAITTPLELSLATTTGPRSEAERLAALALTPGSRSRQTVVYLNWGTPNLPQLNGNGSIALDDLRAPPTLDYPGTFGAEDPHEAAEVDVPYERRAETALADFRRLAGLPHDFAPWLARSNTFPNFLVAQADGSTAIREVTWNPIDGNAEFRSIRYRRDGTVDTSFAPPLVEVDLRRAGDENDGNLSPVYILGQLPDGRLLGRTRQFGFPPPRRWEFRLVAFSGTNAAAGEVLAILEPSLPGAEFEGTFSSAPQFAVINQDGSMIIDQGVRRRGCWVHYLPENSRVTALPSLNGERLRRTRTRLFWKPPVATQFAFRQSRRSRAVREAAGSLTVEVRRLGDLSGTRRVAVRTEDGTARAGQDYQGMDTVLEFEPGRISRSLTIPILNDELREGAETFSVLLSPAPDDPGTSTAMIATPRHAVTIQEDVRLEWSVPNRVRVWNPPYQFNARAFPSLAELQGASPLFFKRYLLQPGASEGLGLSTTQYAPAADYFDLDLTTLPIWSQILEGQNWSTLDEARSAAQARAVFLRVDGEDDDTEETDDFCP